MSLPFRHSLNCLGVALLLGCSHSEPFDAVSDLENDTREEFPADSALRLTFNIGFDGYPFVWRDTVIYSSRETIRQDGDICLSYIPVEGGLTSRAECPDVDGTREYWLEPAVSPDGTTLSYIRETSDTARSRVFPQRRELVVAPYDDPSNASVVISLFPNPLFEMRHQTGQPALRANQLKDTQWIDANTIRAIIGDEDPRLLARFGGDAELFTRYRRIGIIDIDVTSGEWSLIDGLDLPPSSISVSGNKTFFAEAVAIGDNPCDPHCPLPQIKVLNPDGSITEFPPIPGVAPQLIIQVHVGADGQMWAVTGHRAPSFARTGWHLGTDSEIEWMLIPPSGDPFSDQIVEIVSTSHPRRQVVVVFNQRQFSTEIWRYNGTRMQ